MGRYEEIMQQVREKRFEQEVERVDEEYLRRFSESAGSYLESAQKQYEGLGHGNAYQSYLNRRDSYNDLDYRRRVIQEWSKRNPGRLTQQDTNFLDSFGRDSKGILDAFTGARDYFSQFATAEDYEKSLYRPMTKEEAAQGEADMRKKLDEYRRSGRGKADAEAAAGDALGSLRFDPANLDLQLMQLPGMGLNQEEIGYQRAIDYYIQQGKFAQDREIMEADVQEITAMGTEWEDIFDSYMVGMYDLENPNAVSNTAALRNQLYAKFGQKRAEELAESWMRYRSQEGSEEMQQYAQENADSGFFGKVAASGASVFANAMGTLTAPVGYLIEAGNRTGRYQTLDPNNPGALAGQYASTARGEIAKDIEGEEPGFVRKLASFGYQGIMSAADNLVRLAMGGGTKVGSLGLAAVGSFGSTLSEASAKGATPGEAVLMGVSTAALELLTEKYSLDNFFDEAAAGADSVKDILKAVLRQAGVEASEEELSFIGGLAAEALFLREKSGYRQQIGELVAQGYSGEEAKQMADMAIWNEALDTAITSAISGGVMTGVSGTAEYVQHNAQVREQATAAKTEAVDDNLSATDEDSTEVQTGTLEEAAKKYGPQAQAMIHTYQAGQDVKKFNAAYRVAFDMGKSGVKLDYVKNSQSVKYLTEQQVENAYQAGKEAVGSMEASETGSHQLKDSGETVTIRGISSMEGGMKLSLEDGRTVEASKVQFATSEEATVYQAVAGLDLDTQTAQALVDGYNPGGKVSALDYSIGIKQAFRYGEKNLPAADMLRSKYISKLTAGQRTAAYEAGQRAGQQAAQEAQKAVANKQKSGGDGGSVKFIQGGKVTDLRAHLRESGKTLNATQETAIRTMEQLSAALGVDMYVYESYENSQKQRLYLTEEGEEAPAPNGKYYQGGKLYIDLNAGVGGKGTMLYTVAHELTHFIREWSPERFQILADTLMAGYESEGRSVSQLVEDQIRKARKNGRTIDFDTAFEEVVADSMEDVLTSGNVVQMMADLKQQDKTLWQKIRDWFQGLAEDIRALVEAYKDHRPDSAEGQMVAQMQEVLPVLERFYADALSDASENYKAAPRAEKNTTQEGDAKYSVRETRDGQFVAVVESDILKDIDTTSWNQEKKRKAQAAASEALKQFSDGIVVNGVTRVVNRTSRREYTRSKDTARLYRANAEVFADKMRAADVADDIVIAATNWSRDGGLDHPRTDDFVDFDHGRTLIMSGSAKYSAEVVVGITSDGAAVFYDVVDMTPTEFEIKNAEPHSTATTNESIGDMIGGSAGSNVAQNNGEVKEKFSLRDSEGKELTQDQQEYFKDSKVRDEQGQLMVMYHGTPNGNHTTFRPGTYFTPDRQYADVYQSPGASMLSTKKSVDNPKTYEVYLNVKKPFDTRKPKERRIFMQEYYRKWGTGAPLADSGLPDWTDGMDLQEFIEEMGYDYDGLILDEGATGGYGQEVKSRGLSYVVFSSEQVKNVDNKNPTSNPDIRYSDRDNRTYAEIEAERQNLHQREMALAERKRKAVNDPELLKAMDDYSGLFTEMKGLLSKRRNGTATQAELDRIEEIKRLREESMKRVTDLQESLGLNAIAQEESEIRETKEALRIASDAAWAREGAAKENKAIEKAGVSAPEYFRKKALKAFKTTTNFNEAGYLLPDGKLLNFSGGERNHRYRDHREIGEIYEATNGVAAFNRFMSDGNIRIMAESPGVDITSDVEPTKEQYAALRKFVNANGVKDGRFFVDFSDTDGHRAGNYSYDGYINADRVVNDIKYYFEHGTVREQSSIASFLQSERDPEVEKIHKRLEKENGKLREDVEYLKEMLKLQKTGTQGKKFTRSSVDAAAGLLMKQTDSQGTKKELAGLLNGLYEHIAGSEELTWESVKEAAQPAVDWLRTHKRQNKKLDGFAQEVLKNIRGSKVYLSENQQQEAAYISGSFNDFRKSLMGNVTVTKTGGISLDEQWQEWAGMYPSVFDPNISASDMPRALTEAIQTLRGMRSSEHAYGMLEEQELLRMVYDSYWNVSTLYTVADAKQKEITRLKNEHSKRMTKLREDHKSATAQLKKEHEADLEAVRKEMRDEAEKQRKDILAKHEASRKKTAENRRKAEMRRKIRRTVMELNKLLNKGDKKRNVKEGMQDLVSEALRSADILFTENYTNEDMIRNGVGTDLTEQESKYLQEAREILEQMENLPSGSYEAFEARQETEAQLKSKLGYRMSRLQDVFARERARLNRTKISEVLNSLADAYASLQNSEQSYVSEGYHENVYQYLLMLKGDVGGTTVKDMSLNQLEELHKAYTMVLTTVRNANKMFAQNLKQTREQLGNQAIAEVQAAGGEHGLWAPGEDKISAFSWNNEKPVYAFERIGSETLTRLFENTRAGEDGWARDMTEARAFYLDQIRKHKYDSWDFDKQYKFTSSSGVNFSLNLGQIMSLYAYSKREQAHDHLLKGGFVFDSNTEVQVNKMGVKLTYLNKTAKAHNVSQDILADIVSQLTDEQKAFVDEMQDYLSTTMGGKGNEVSLQLYGVKLFNEKHYFPLRSAGQYMERAKEADLKKQQGQISIVNSGFTKATTPKSSNPVVLSGFMDVWADHVNEMSMYHSFVLPMEDFRRVYNYSSPNVEEGQSISVNSVIQDAYGEAATGYIDQLYRDLNGGAVSDPRETPAKALMGKFKKAAVFASLSVVVQQPSAIGRAFAIIDPKYFIGAKVDSKLHKQLWAELKQYAPVATIKEMGYFDTGMGKSAQDFIQAKEYKTLKEKAAALFTDADYRDELLGKMPALADELTWCAIWEAAKRETKAKNPGMNVKSEDFLQLAAKRFTEVVTKTQVYDSVLSRSANMRSKGAFMSMWTAFMAEPTTTINMVEDALRKARKGNKQYAARAMGAVMTSVVINSLLASLVYAMRDDDEDETFLEKYVQSVATEILDGINPITYYPFLKDVWSVMQGYDIERSDMSLITSLVEKITKLVKVYSKDTEDMDEEELAEHNRSLANAWWGVTDYLTALLGIPVKNVRRDINGAANMFKTISQDLTDRDTTWGSLIDKTLENVKNAIPVVGWLPDATAADKLYKATVSGDAAYRKRLESAYSSQTSLDNAIRKGLRANDSRIWEAAIAWNNNDLEGYKRLAKEIIDEGYFSQDNVAMAIQAEAKAMLPKENESAAAPKAKGYFNMDKFAVAIAQGNASMAAVIKADIIDTAVKNGKSVSEAEKSFASSVSSACKDLYLDGTMSQKQAVDALAVYGGYDKDRAQVIVDKWRAERETGIAYDDIDDAFLDGKINVRELRQMYMTYGGLSQEDAEEQVVRLSFVKENPALGDISYAAVRDYTEYCEHAGVKPKVFYDAWKYKNSLEGSVKEPMLEYINSLNLTPEQKDSLYLAFGWAESKLRNAPWH